MNERPRIKIPFDSVDLVLEAITGILLLATWVIVIVKYPEMSETIPIHYDIGGNIDGYGSKVTIFILPIISTILYVGLLILNKYPHKFNYPTKITEKNAERQYRAASKLIRFLKLSIIILFLLLSIDSIYDSGGEVSLFGIWFIPITAFSVFIPLLVYAFLYVRKR